MISPTTTKTKQYTDISDDEIREKIESICRSSDSIIEVKTAIKEEFNCLSVRSIHCFKTILESHSDTHFLLDIYNAEKETMISVVT